MKTKMVYEGAAEENPMNLGTRRRRGRKNPLGSGFPIGVLAGVGLLGAIWGLTYYRAQKANAVSGGSSGNCYLCLQPSVGTVPPGATSVVNGTYKGFPYSTYKLGGEMGWGATIAYDKAMSHSDSVWSQPSAAAALALVKTYADKEPVA